MSATDWYAPNQQAVRADGSGPAEEGDGGSVPEPGPGNGNGDGVPTGTVQDVLDWVGDDPARAQRAIDVERAKSSPRSSLLDALEAIAG